VVDFHGGNRQAYILLYLKGGLDLSYIHPDRCRQNRKTVLEVCNGVVFHPKRDDHDLMRRAEFAGE
jgi:hypothetical protein